MNKINNFDEWIVTVMELFDINKDYKLVSDYDEVPRDVTMEQFINLSLKTEGWQQVLMTTVDYICVNNLYKDASELTKYNLARTKRLVLEYFEDFVISAYKAGYTF